VKTSRLKSIVIVVLALLNLCLLAMLAIRQVQERAARERADAELLRLFAASGVELPAHLIPREETHLSPIEPARSPEAEAAFAAALLGDCAPEDVGGGIYRYVSGAGQCLLRASGAVEASLELGVEDPETFFEGVFAANGYAALYSDVNNGSGTVTAVRMLERGMVFNARLTLEFSDNRLISVDGSFVPPAAESGQGENLDGVTALVRFLDYIRENGEVCTVVSDVRAGYLLQSTASAAQRLIPAWRIGTDVTEYYVNMTTGEVSRES